MRSNRVGKRRIQKSLISLAKSRVFRREKHWSISRRKANPALLNSERDRVGTHCSSLRMVFKLTLWIIVKTQLKG